MYRFAFPNSSPRNSTLAPLRYHPSGRKESFQISSPMTPVAFWWPEVVLLRIDIQHHVVPAIHPLVLSSPPLLLFAYSAMVSGILTLGSYWDIPVLMKKLLKLLIDSVLAKGMGLRYMLQFIIGAHILRSSSKTLLFHNQASL